MCKYQKVISPTVNECLLGRYGGRVSPGVCELCQTSNSNKMAGLGDLVALTISKLTRGRMKKTSGCGCARRQELLNKAVPFV